MPEEPTSNAGIYVFMAIVLAVAAIALIVVAHTRKNDADLAENSDASRVRPKWTAVQNTHAAKIKALTAPAAAASKYQPIDLSSAFNADVLGKLSNLKYEARVAIPGVVPRAYFHMGPLDANNAVQLNEPATIFLPIEKRAKFREIAFLHGADGAGGMVDATVHYSTGDDDTLQLHVLDWHAKNRKDAPESREFATVQTLSADGRLDAELFAQEFSVDPLRVLESITFSKRGGAAILGISGILEYDVK
ncbi:MAG TPA: hypothetical protein VKX17_28400 [Planctomycetota bacterium]|nr:hypothetical protein [Planctomycetota bacterium]